MGDKVVRVYVPLGTWGTRFLEVGNHLPAVLIAGPCQIESLDHALATAEYLAALSETVGMPFIYKSSYDKANRTSGKTPRGVGLDKGLRILERVRAEIGCPVTTDVHTPEEAYVASSIIDLLQVPALLSRQTDLLRVTGAVGKAVSVKKFQGANPVPWAAGVVDKVDNQNTILIERGNSFGYGLVNDFTQWPLMKAYAPVVFDATHSVQSPSSQFSTSGGSRDRVPDLAAAAMAVGIAGVFIECHPRPDEAPSDGPCMVAQRDMPDLLYRIKRIDEAAKG